MDTIYRNDKKAVERYRRTGKGVPWGEGGYNGYPDQQGVIYNFERDYNPGNRAGMPHDVYGKYERMRRLNEGLHEQYPKYSLPLRLDTETLERMANPYNYDGQYDRLHNLARHFASYPAGDEVVPVTIDEFHKGVRRYPETLEENINHYRKPSHDELNARARTNAKQSTGAKPKFNFSSLYGAAAVPFGMAMAGQDPVMNGIAGVGVVGANLMNAAGDAMTVAQPFMDAYDYVQTPEYIQSRIEQMEDMD